MKRTPLVTRPRTAAVATAVAALALAGCSTLSPHTVIEPYDAADGVSAELSDGTIGLRNMLVVSAEEGAPGVVLGSLINEGDQATVVSLMAAVPDGGNPAEARIRVPARGAVQLGAARVAPVVIEAVPGAPGGVISLSVQTPGGGSVELSAPIVPQSGYYASFTAPAPSATATPSAAPAPTGAEATPTESPTESATP